MSNAVQTVTIIGGLGTLLALVVGLQTFWINRSLGRVEDALKDARTELKGEIKETRGELRQEIRDTRDAVSEIKDVLMRDYGERIAKLEDRVGIGGER
jgi:hypothetical protein